MAYPEKVFPPLDKRHAQADLLSRSTRRNVRPGILWFDEYTYMHSVSVCALMIALARQLGLPAETVREAGLAGLLQRASGSDAGAEPEGAAGAEGEVAADLSKPGIEDRIVGRESAAAWGFEHLDELWSGITRSRA